MNLSNLKTNSIKQQIFKFLLNKADVTKETEPVEKQEPVSSVPEESKDAPSIEKDTAETAPVAETKPKISIKIDTIGVSFSGLRGQKARVADKNTEEDTANEEDIRFTDEKLQVEWQMMCNRMPESMVGIARRMNNMKPVITDYPNIELVIDNKMLFDEMSEIRGRINATLVKALHNAKVNLTLRLASEEEVGRVLSEKERYEELLEENSAVKKLDELFELVLG